MVKKVYVGRGGRGQVKFIVGGRGSVKFVEGGVIKYSLL